MCSKTGFSSAGSMRAVLGRHLLTLGACLLLVATPSLAKAKVAAADIFMTHMVLQQEMPVPVWGTADAGETVTVRFGGQEHQATADAQGKWRVNLTPLKATANQQGQSLVIEGKDNTITLEDVLIGEVWLCSGQSNMAWQVAASNNAKQERLNANYPEIRMFHVNRNTKGRQPLDTLVGRWSVCSPQSAGSFSATAYYFGRKLHKDLGVPVGLINTSVGGTRAEAWTSGDALSQTMPEFDKAYTELVHPGRVLDKAIAQYENDAEAYAKEMAKLLALEADMEASSKLASPDYDDSQWPTMEAPGQWQGEDLKDQRGMVWFRKTIDVPAEWAGKDLTLDLGKIFSVDVTWFNGQEVGQTGNLAKNQVRVRQQVRTYRVPGQFVKAGKNVIAVRMLTIWYNGGFMSGANTRMALEPADAPKSNSDQAIDLSGQWRYQIALLLPRRPVDPQHAHRPSVLFNGMIHPLIPYAIRGAIWYQGESNVSRNELYQRLLTTLITDWRTRWGQGEFPFLVVQLPNYGRPFAMPTSDAWTLLREAQARVARAMPNVELAVTLDIGDPRNIHPGNKQDVGKRLALIAEEKTYGKDVVSSGPTLRSFQIKGSDVHVTFDHAEGGLVQKGEKLTSFGLREKDGQWVWADARIEGDKVIVSSPDVKTPVAVSHAWARSPEITLYNKAGLPAHQFNSEAP